MASSGDVEWVGRLCAAVDRACEAAPSLAPTPLVRADVAFRAARVRALFATLRHAPLEGAASHEIADLLERGVTRAEELSNTLSAFALAGTTDSFVGFDDLAFARRARQLDAKALARLADAVFLDPARATSFDAIARMAVLEEFGLGRIGRGVVILFKLVVILILLLACIGHPGLVPFALAVVAALAKLDSAGEGDDNKPGPRTSGQTTPAGSAVVTPGAGGSTVVQLPDGTVIINNPGGPIVVTPPGGPPTVYWPPAQSPQPPGSSAPAQPRKTCRSTYPDIQRCDELPDAYEFDSEDEALRALEEEHELREGALSATDEKIAEDGPCAGQGLHYDAVDRNGKHWGSLANCPCCEDGAEGPKRRRRWRIFP